MLLLVSLFKLNIEWRNLKPKNKFKYPSIGVGVFLLHMEIGKLLIGKRNDSGLLGLPGGWLEFGENWEDCASRELYEETNLRKPSHEFHHMHTLNCRFLDKGHHNISCIMFAEVNMEELPQIKNNEPDKCLGWYWISLSEMRGMIDNLFYPLQQFLKQFQNLKTVENLKNMATTY